MTGFVRKLISVENINGQTFSYFQWSVKDDAIPDDQKPMHGCQFIGEDFVAQADAYDPIAHKELLNLIGAA